jgi:predicted Rossmann fold nucleotide-binding protein DprA/Smf involved in DNA uptake
MTESETLDAIMLWELPGVGEKAAQRILATNRERGRSLATFFRLPPAVLQDEYDLPGVALARIGEGRAEHEARCRWLAQRLEANDAEVHMAGASGYPHRLIERLRPPPALLASVGEPGVLALPTLTVLNSRDLDERVVIASHAAVRAAIEQGFALVSGGMKASHRIVAVAARAAAAPRAVVLDRGLFATFGAATDRDPFGLGPGRGPFDRRRTLALSPFRLCDHAVAHNGKRRDELVAALADVIVVVHARPGGVIERVCLEALDRGQVVLSWYGENAGLIEAGAAAIEEADLSGELLRYLSRS